jgi:hypothetical protein
MPLPHFEIPAGVIDGVNLIFTVSAPYVPGSTAVFLNGQLKTQLLDDGWDETAPLAGTITLKEAPRGSPGCPDVVQVFYLDTSPALPETVVERLTGTITEGAPEDTLTATMLPESPLGASVDDSDGLAGVILLDELQGVVQDGDPLRGFIVEVC